jgi:hypothetical protein
MAYYDYDFDSLFKFYTENDEMMDKLEERLKEQGLELFELDNYDTKTQLLITEIMLSLKSEVETGVSTKILTENPKHRFMNCRCRACNKIISIDFNIRAVIMDSIFDVIIDKGYCMPQKEVVITEHECSGKEFAKNAIMDVIGESEVSPKGADFYITIADEDMLGTELKG